MALNIGSLVGYLDLDASGFESTLGGALDKLRDLGPKGAAIAGAAGAAIGVAIAGAVTQGMDLEKANDKLAAQLGANGPEAERLGRIAGDVYAGAWGDSMEQVDQAIGAVMGNISGMREASDEDLQAATQTALDFATAMDVDVSDAAVSAGALVNNGLAKNATEAFDLLTAAAQKAGPTMVQPVLDATNEYSKHFAMLGYDGQAAMTVISTAASGGEIAIDKAGDAVKEFGIRATDLNDTGAQDALKALGLSGKSMADDLLAGGDRAQGATEKIATALLGVKDPAKQAALAGGLFGTQIEDIGKDNLPGFLGALSGAGPQLDDVAGAAGRMGDTLNDNASTNLESFKRQAQQAFVNTLGGRVLPIVSTAASTLATQFGPALQAIGEWIQNPVLPSLQQLGQFISDNQTPITIVAGLIAAVFIPHLIALGIQSLIAGGKAVAGWVMQQGAAIAGAAVHSVQVLRVVGGWVLMGVQSLLQAGRMAAAWFIALGPIGWAIAAIIAIAAIVTANWDKIAGWTKKAWTAVSHWVTEKAGAAIGWVKAHWPLILAILTGPIGLAVLFIVRNWDKITAGAQRMKDAVVGKLGELVAWVKSVPGKIASGLGDLGGLLVQKGKDLISGLISGAGSMLSSLGSFFLDKVPGWIREPFKKALGIASPSRVMAALSRWIPLGVVKGVKSEAGTVHAAMRDLVTPPDVPALEVPRVRLPARTVLDPGVNRAAAAGYAAGRDPIDYDRLARAMAKVQVSTTVSARDIDSAMAVGI